MAGKSDYLENKILDYILGITAFTPPATLYFALFTAAPSDSGGGSEVTGGSYGRIAKTNNVTNFPNAASGSKSNGTAIDFATASAAWGTAVAVAIFDASVAGNLLYWALLTTPIVIPSGGQLSFAIGQLVFSEE